MIIKKSITQLFLIFILIVFFSIPTLAQIPDEFENLQVIDKAIKKGELIRIMKGFTNALGFRCNNCHVGGSANSLDGMDFTSDEKQEKKTAREMLRMVNMLNSEYISKVFGNDKTGIKVECVTCHRGQPHPKQIGDVLMSAYNNDGYESAAAVYDSLREQYYGSHTFNFSSGVLTKFAETVSRSGKTEDAIKFLTLNDRYNPGEIRNNMLLGQLYMKIGNKEAAIKSMEQVLKIYPENRRAARMLERFKAK